ncbi:MAG TPA: TonB family protein [Candidatus Acidoferrum sp.]|nr:TonB family protein [Candidatus Acidoferrum sp.]
MTVAVANPSLASPDDLSLRRFLVYSLFLHGAVAAAMVVSIVFHFEGNRWGDVGGGSEGEVKVNLVGSVGIPMPKPPDVTESKTFDPTDSLYKTLPQPKPPESPKPEVKIPAWKEKPKPVQRPSRVFDDPTPAPPNAVAANGGKLNLPTGTRDVAGAPNPGVNIQGQGGGDFAARYGWYIDAVRRRISQNWMQSTIDPGLRAARTAKCTMTFTIARDGTVKDIRLAKTSGNSSMDTSAQRALLSSSPMPPLPSDYSGSYVNVTFDFDLAMTR